MIVKKAFGIFVFFMILQISPVFSVPLSLEVSCSQIVDVGFKVSCSIVALSSKNSAFVTGQTISYNVTNESVLSIASGTASERGQGIYNFSFVPTRDGNYFVLVNSTTTDIVGTLINASASTVVYARTGDVTAFQNDTVYQLQSNFTTLNSTLMAIENFGSNNLTDLKNRLVEQLTFLNLLRSESKENVILVTDAVASTNNLLQKAEAGSLTPEEAKQLARQIREKIIAKNETSGQNQEAIKTANTSSIFFAIKAKIVSFFRSIFAIV